MKGVDLSYPADMERQKKTLGYVVSFPDLPEALTGGIDLAEALQEATDCLGSAISFRMLD